MGFSIGKVFKPIEIEMRKYANVDSIYLPESNYKPLSLWRNIRYVQKAVAQKNYDIVHITGAEHYLIPFLRKQKVIVTVHDLGFYTNHRGNLRAVWKYWLWIRTLAKASKVTFISEKSKIEAERLVKFRSAQTIVVDNPVSEEFKYTEKEFNRNCPTILQVGTKPNKNIENTIRALKGINCRLRFVGPLTDRQRMLLAENDIDYTSVENISDEELLQEYRNCDIVSFASFYEGFGMPIIEGQAIGRAVVTSDVDPMNVIAGEGCVLVDPENIESIRIGYERLMSEKGLYERIVEIGLRNVLLRFSVGSITKAYYNVYKSINNC